MESGSWGRPAVSALAYAVIFAGFANVSAPAPAQAQARPIAGFAPADVTAIVEAWPFGPPAYSASSLGGGNGAPEAALKDLMAAIRSDPRFVPPQRPGRIAEGAILRPPPDSILWPGVADGGAAVETLTASGDLAPWILISRQEASRHQANARILEAVTPEGLEQAGVGLSFVSALTGPAIAAESLVAATYIARPLEDLIDTRVEGCEFDPRCTAVRRAAQWAGRGVSEPVHATLGQAVLDAASVGAFMDTPAERMAAMTGRANQRQRLDVAPPAAGGAQNRYRIEAVERLPWEMAAVLGAAVLEMRKLEKAGPTWPVIIDESAARALKEPVFRYQGFDLSAIAVTRYQRAMSGAFDLSAILTFLDGGGRRASVSAVLSFLITEETIQIVTAELAFLAPPEIRVRVAIVPTESAPELAPEIKPDVDPVAAMIQSVENEVTPQTEGSVPQSFDILAFFLDRMPPDAEVQIRLGEQPDGATGYAAGSTLDFDGWRVVRLRGAFALNGPTEFFIKAVYQPGGPVPGFDRDPQVLQVVSSHGNPRAEAPAISMAPAGERTFPNLIGAP